MNYYATSTDLSHLLEGKDETRDMSIGGAKETLMAHIAGWREISRQEFFATVGKMDVTPYPHGRPPYTSNWKLRSGEIVGKVVDRRMSPNLYLVPADTDIPIR